MEHDYTKTGNIKADYLLQNSCFLILPLNINGDSIIHVFPPLLTLNGRLLLHGLK